MGFSAHSGNNQVAHSELQFTFAATTVSSQVEMQKPHTVADTLKVSMLPGNMAASHNTVEPLAGANIVKRHFTMQLFPGNIRASELDKASPILQVDGVLLE